MFVKQWKLYLKVLKYDYKVYMIVIIYNQFKLVYKIRIFNYTPNNDSSILNYTLLKGTYNFY